MAWPDNATTFPVYGQAYDFEAWIFSSSTGNPLTGALTTLEGYVSVDGAAYATTGVTVANTNSDGCIRVSIDATRMTGKIIGFRIQTATANAIYACGEIRPLDLAETTTHWLSHTVKKIEQGWMQLNAKFLNKRIRARSSGLMTTRNAADSADYLTETFAVDQTNVTKGKQN